MSGYRARYDRSHAQTNIKLNRYEFIKRNIDNIHSGNSYVDFITISG